MPRTARVVLPNYPHHVVQRGHNRQVVFAGDDDFRRYLKDLRELKVLFDVRVYGWCLMANHVHLLLVPGDDAAGLSRLMKALAARATRYRNKLEGRSGTLWESRYKSSPVQTDRYLLACLRYIELNPVRAGLVADPADYPWSSFNARMQDDVPGGWPDRAPFYQTLGSSEPERRRRYVAFVRDAIAPEEWRLIREALQRGQLTGNDRFVAEVEATLGLRVERRGQGRPRRAKR